MRYDPENPNPEFKGIWIPADLWLHPGLTLFRKCLLAQIDALSSKTRGCYASDRYLAKVLGTSPAYLANEIGELAKEHFIERTSAADENQPNGRRRELRWFPVQSWPKPSPAPAPTAAAKQGTSPEGEAVPPCVASKEPSSPPGEGVLNPGVKAGTAAPYRVLEQSVKKSGGGDLVHVSSREKSQSAPPAAAAGDVKTPKPVAGTPCEAQPAAAASEGGVRTPAEARAFHDALIVFGCTEADALQISGLNRSLKAGWVEAWNAEVVRRAGTSKPFRSPVGWLIRAAASGEWPSQAAQRAAERAAAVPVVEPHRAYQPAIVKDDPKIMARIMEREAAHQARLRAQGLAL